MSTPPREIRPFVTLPRGIAPLGYRNFDLYWLGWVVSSTGRWIEVTGAVWLMYELTGSPVLLGLLGASRALPSVLLSSVAGVIADRVDQRRLLVMTQGLGLLASLSLGLIVLSGRVEFWHLYVQAAAHATIATFDQAVRQALFPRLVPREHLAEAVTLHAAAGRTSHLVGPAIGGIVIARLGVAAPFFMYAAMSLALMGAVSAMRGVKPRTAVPGSTFRGELIDGVRHILNAPVLSGLLKLEVVFGIFSMNPVMITIIGIEVLHVGPEALGVLLSGPAIGSFIGILLLLWLGHARRQGRFVFLSTTTYAAGLAAFALSREYVTSLALLSVLGLLDTLVTVTRQSVMQLAAPPRMRGRVMSNVGMVTRTTGPLAQTQSGALASAIGGPPAVLVAAGVLALASALGATTNRALWSYSRAQAPEPPGTLGVPIQVADTPGS